MNEQERRSHRLTAYTCPVITLLQLQRNVIQTEKHAAFLFRKRARFVFLRDRDTKTSSSVISILTF